MNKKGYCFPISVQLSLPEDYNENKEAIEMFQTLNDLGFYGVELNIADPSRFDYNKVTSFLSEFNLKFSMFASGLTAKIFGLSLSHNDKAIRKAAIKKVKEIIDFVIGSDTGIILGFFKGQSTLEKEISKKNFNQSMEDIAPYAIKKTVKILIEATNRYESDVANSLEEASSIVKKFNNPLIQILPDTFHMNIEEVNILESLKENFKYYKSVHLSNNNRFFPAFCGIDFKEIIDFLKLINFQGGVALEGNLKKDFVYDIKKTMEYLIPILQIE